MRRAIRIELYKLIISRTTWFVLGCFLVLLLMSLQWIRIGDFQFEWQSAGSSDAGPGPFPPFWHFSYYVAGFLHYLPAALLIIMICRDRQSGLLRQHLAEGIRRDHYLISKGVTALMLVLLCTVSVAFTAWPVQSLFEPMGVPDGNFPTFAGRYSLQLFAYLLFAGLTAVWIPKTAGALLFMLFYLIAFEPLLLLISGDGLSAILPMQYAKSLIPNPVFAMVESAGEFQARPGPVWPVLVVTGIFISTIYLRFRTADV